MSSSPPPPDPRGKGKGKAVSSPTNHGPTSHLTTSLSTLTSSLLRPSTTTSALSSLQTPNKASQPSSSQTSGPSSASASTSSPSLTLPQTSTPIQHPSFRSPRSSTQTPSLPQSSLSNLLSRPTAHSPSLELPLIHQSTLYASDGAEVLALLSSPTFDPTFATEPPPDPTPSPPLPAYLPNPASTRTNRLWQLLPSNLLAGTSSQAWQGVDSGYMDVVWGGAREEETKLSGLEGKGILERGWWSDGEGKIEGSGERAVRRLVGVLRHLGG